MKSLHDQVKAGTTPLMTEQEILDKVVPSDNRKNMSGRGRKMTGTSKSKRRPYEEDYITREQMTELLRWEHQEKELYKNQTEEAQQRAIVAEQEARLARETANATNSRMGTFESFLGQFFTFYNNQGNPFPVPFPPPNPAPFPGHSPFPGPATLQAPFPDLNNVFNSCYRPSFLGSITCPGSSSNYEMPPPEVLNKYLLPNNPHLRRIRENIDVSSSEEEAEVESDEE